MLPNFRESQSPTDLVKVAPEGPRQLPALYDPQFAEHDAETRGDALSLLHYYHLLMERKWLLLSVAGTVLFLAALQVFTTTPLYEATALLQVDPEESKVLPYEQVAAQGGADWSGEYRLTQAKKLESSLVGDKVYRQLDLDSDPRLEAKARAGVLVEVAHWVRKTVSSLVPRSAESKQAAAGEPPRKELPGELEVTPIRNTRLISISFSSPHPDLAAEVANTLGEEFIELNLVEKYDATVRATDFLRGQLQDLKVRMEQSEEALLRYAQEKGIVNLTEKETVYRQQFADLSEELTKAESELIVFSSRDEAARTAGQREFPEVLENEQARVLAQRLSELEGNLAKLSARYGPQWPEVKDTREQIAEVKQQLAAERKRVLGSASSDHRLARDRRDRLTSAVAEQRAIVERLDQDSVQYGILQREVETNKELYQGLLQRLKEAGIAAGLRSSNIRLVEQAEAPRSPSAPRKLRAMALAAILGLGLGIGVVLFADAIDNSVSTPEEVNTQLGLPALGVVPSLAVTSGSRWPAFFGRAKSVAESRMILAREVLEGSVHGLRGSAWEAYRSLRMALLLSHAGKPPQTILVTSSVPEEGKTTTSLNTAIALAQTGARTLFLELDLRRPVIADSFGVSSAAGVSTYLTGNTDLSSQIVESGLPNLFLLPSGPTPPNPPELLGSERMSTGLELLRGHFTYIIVDAPPVLQLSDALVLAPQVDGVILVARGGKTPRAAIRRAAEAIARVGGSILGVVINDVDMTNSSYGGYYGYYQRSGYHGYYDRPAADSPTSSS